MFGFFKKKKSEFPLNYKNIGVDMHSHILPGIDDGAPTVKHSVQLAQHFLELGFQKVIATPHIMADYYRNNRDSILKALEETRSEFCRFSIPLQLEAAAEYYLDETFENKLNAGNLMLIENEYLLFELSYVNYPANLKEIIQKINDKGYKPILAHPERYPYLYGSLENFYQIKEYGCYFQLNTISLNGYYGKQTQKIAEELAAHHLVDFIGSDMHHLKHAEALKKTLHQTSAAGLLQESYGLQNARLI